MDTSMIFDNTTIDLFKHIVRMDGFMELPAEGYSMYPYIRRGDICQFIPCDSKTLIKGDVVLFHTETGQLIAHRFSHSRKIKNVQRYYFKGDTNISFDLPVTEYQLIGKLVRIQRMDKEIIVENLISEWWGKLVLEFPFISGILREYLNWRIRFRIWFHKMSLEITKMENFWNFIDILFL